MDRDAALRLCIESRRRTEGRAGYPDSNSMLILTDSGGSNGRRPRVWKPSPCDRHGSLVHVALPQWLLQMESDRVPPVQLPPRQLTGRTAGEFRGAPERHPHYNHFPEFENDGPLDDPPLRPEVGVSDGQRAQLALSSDAERPLRSHAIRRQENRRSRAAAPRLCKSAGISTEPVPTTG